MKKIQLADDVRNEEMQKRIGETRSIAQMIRKAN